MKKFTMFIIVVALLLSSCGISRTVMTETNVVESQSEHIISESSLTTAETAGETMKAPIKTIVEVATDPMTKKLLG